MRVPELPSKEEQERHNPTHIPYAPWCDGCAIGLWQGEAHRRRQGEVLSPNPVLDMDYCFLALEDGDAETATILVIQDSVSSYTGAARAPAKGPTPRAVAFPRIYLDELGYPR
eukprot:1180340-Pyramimonas_sp.AAC.1